MSYDDHSHEKPSKSQRKREVHALQELGEELVKLSPHRLTLLPLPSELLQAIKEAQMLSSHGAIRRQLQYIGRLMREIDVEPIQAAYKKILQGNVQSNEAHHELEKLRDQLLQSTESALADIAKRYSHFDRVYVKELIRKAHEENQLQKPPKSSRTLFRYLRKLQEENPT